MKKRFYMPLTLAAIAVMAGGCTASDPDNPKNISEAITDGDSDNKPNDPVEHNLLSDYSIGNRSYYFDYSTDRRLQKVTYSNSSWRQYERQATFNYIGGQDQPVSMEWSYEEKVNDGTVRYRIVDAALDNMEFDGSGLLKSAIYSARWVNYDYNDYEINAEYKDQFTSSAEVAFEYDSEGHLVKISVGNEVFNQTWVDGDLVEINSPWFGESTLTYSDIVNRYAQWDPTLPFMGYLQAFGWFGKCPKHFPKSVNTAFEPVNGGIDDSQTYGLDYYLNYEGLMTQSKWQQSLTYSVDVNYNFINFN